MAISAIIIDFQNASVFRNRSDSSDKTFVDGEVVKRKDSPRFDVPNEEIDARHVANLLHVMMGERPVPSFRKSWAIPDEQIVSAASQSRYIIDEVASQETKNCRKAVRNSWQTSKITYRLKRGATEVKGGLLYPARLRRFLGGELYDEFMALSDQVSKVTGEAAPSTVHRRIEILSQQGDRAEVQAFARKCKVSRRNDIFNLISPEGDPDSISLHTFRPDSWANMLLVPGGPETVSRYNGTIIVPAGSADFVERLNNGTGVATFLEGGFATLKGIESWSEALLSGTNLVKMHPTLKAHVSN
jgi:hypothetical protein